MGMLVNGTWFDDDPPAGSGGQFLRPDSMFRGRVTRDGSSGFKAEAGRYQLVTAPSCPWAHRTVLMHKLKRLEGTIEILQSDLPKGEGWAYSRGLDDIEPIGGVLDPGRLLVDHGERRLVDRLDRVSICHRVLGASVVGSGYGKGRRSGGLRWYVTGVRLPQAVMCGHPHARGDATAQARRHHGRDLTGCACLDH